MKVPGITLSNGHVLRYTIASGALAYDGQGWLWDQPFRWLGLLREDLFTTVAKTVTSEPRKGNYRWWNPFGCVRFIPRGTVNAFGLTNPGIEWFCQKVGPRIDSSKSQMIGSILGEPEELVEMARMLNDLDLVALEVNASCPNTGNIAVLSNSVRTVRGFEEVKNVSRFPLIGKLSVVHDARWITRSCEGLLEAISINSVPWKTAFPFRESPLARLGGGGVSGKAAQPHTWKFVTDLVGMTDIPIIGPSIWDYEDIDKVLSLGVDAVSFGSVLMKYPPSATKYTLRHQREN